jgi:hypothetical protein
MRFDPERESCKGYATCCHLSPAACCFLASLSFDPEDGGDTFLRNVGLRTEYTALCPRMETLDECNLSLSPVSSALNSDAMDAEEMGPE